MEDRQTSAYICHAAEDQDVALFLRDELENFNIDAYFNSGLETGLNSYDSVRKEIDRRENMLLLVSEHAFDSEPVGVELSIAQHSNKPVIPVMLIPLELDEGLTKRFKKQFWYVSEVTQVDLTGFRRRDEERVNKAIPQLLVALGIDAALEQVRTYRTTFSLETKVEPAALLSEHPVLAEFILTKRLYVMRPVTRGRSGSKVYVVKAVINKSDAKPQTCFMKLHHAMLGEEINGKPIPQVRHEKAYEVFRDYMPRLLDATPVDRQTAEVTLLYQVEGPVDSLYALDQLLQRRIATARKLVQTACNALYQWNTPIRDHHYDFSTPQQILLEAIGHSEDPSVQERRLKDRATSIFARLYKQFRLTHKMAVIHFEGDGFDRRTHWPNPLAYLAHGKLWAHKEHENIEWVRGHIHGDMNTRNLLWTGNPNKPLLVIDFDTYDPSNLMLLDFAQMELGILLELFNLEDRANRREIVSFSEYLARQVRLDDMPDLGLLAVGANEILKPIRLTVDRFLADDANLEPAFWLARMAVGLEMSRKTKVHALERVFALLYAADSLDTLLNFFHITPVQDGQSPPINWNNFEGGTYNIAADSG